MNDKAFKTIAALLGISLISFFVIQGLWIRNSFAVAKEEIKRAAYEAMRETARKLELREDIREIKNNIFLETEDSIPGGGKTKLKIVLARTGKDSLVKTLENISNISGDEIPVPPDVPDVPLVNGNNIIMIDSEMRVSSNGKNTVIIKKTKSLSEKKRRKNLNQLMTKMLVEINSIDVSPLEKMNADTLKNIIVTQLKQNGIQGHFEYAILQPSQDKTRNEKLLFSSGGFQKEKMAMAYVTKLFQGNIFKKNEMFYLYFPSENSLAFSRMRALLILSGIFASIILFAFIYTLQLLLKQKKLAEIKNDFINNMTHELKTPIATISIAADALKNPKVKNDEEKLDYYSSVIKEENNKMNRNVEKVLQLAQTEKENFKPEFAEVNLHQLVEKCISNFEVLFRNKNIRYEFLPSAERLTLNADAFLLENAFNNIIDNAIKYSAPGTEVKIKTGNREDKILVSVEDNGIGMNNELQKKIFEKFYRAQTGNIHDVKGFGIGLSYAYNIIRAHKGEISVKSKEDKGSVFTIELNVI